MIQSAKAEDRRAKGEERKAKAVWFFIALLPSLLAIRVASAAETTLQSWAENITKPEVQQEILNKVFPGQIGPVSTGKKDEKTGMYFLPKNDAWVRLGDFIWSPSEAKVPAYLVVAAMYYNKLEGDPATTATYLFRDTSNRPAALSAGYASFERAHKITFTMLGKSFLLLINASGKPENRQWSAVMLEMRAGRLDRPKAVWKSPMAVREFQLGIDYMGGAAEMLILRTKRGNETQYMAYSYKDGKFEVDEFFLDTRLMQLPETFWLFGAGK